MVYALSYRVPNTSQHQIPNDLPNVTTNNAIVYIVIAFWNPRLKLLKHPNYCTPIFSSCTSIQIKLIQLSTNKLSFLLKLVISDSHSLGILEYR